jgi:hypothetical protein
MSEYSLILSSDIANDVLCELQRITPKMYACDNRTKVNISASLAARELIDNIVTNYRYVFVRVRYSS